MVAGTKVYVFGDWVEGVARQRYACSASSAGEARSLAHLAGHADLTIIDEDPLPALDRVALDREVLTDARLGGEWIPVLDVLDFMVGRIASGQDWSVSVNRRGERREIGIRHAPDGSLRAEFRPLTVIERTASARLVAARWSREGGDAIWVQAWSAGWRSRPVALALLVAMAWGCDVEINDLLSFDGFADAVDELALLDRYGEDDLHFRIKRPPTETAARDGDEERVAFAVEAVASLIRATSGFTSMDEWEIRRRRRAGQGRLENEARARAAFALESLGLAAVPAVIADEMRMVGKTGPEGHSVVMDAASAVLARSKISAIDYSRLTTIFATVIGRVDAGDPDRIHEWWGIPGPRIRKFYDQVARLRPEERARLREYYRTGAGPDAHTRSAALDALLASGRRLPWPLGRAVVLNGDPVTDALLGIVVADLVGESSHITATDVERLGRGWSTVVSTVEPGTTGSPRAPGPQGSHQFGIEQVLPEHALHPDTADGELPAPWLGPELVAHLGATNSGSDAQSVTDAIFQIKASIPLSELFPLLAEEDWPDPIELSTRLAPRIAGAEALRQSSIQSLLVLRNVGPLSVRSAVLALARHAQALAGGHQSDIAKARRAKAPGGGAGGGLRPDETPAQARRRERDAAIIEARQGGATLEEIGEQFGVTRERIRQILRRSGGPTATEARAARSRTAALDDAQITEEIRSVLARRGPSTPDEVADEVSEPRERVSSLWPKDLAHLKIRGAAWVSQEWSDDQVFGALRAAALYAFPLTTSEYRRLTSIGEVLGPSVPRIHQRFGSWSKACELAGVEAGQAPRDNYQSRWTDEELLEFARQYLEDPAFPNSFQGFDDWRREVDPEGPSGMTLRNRLGRWEDIKRAALGPRR